MRRHGISAPSPVYSAEVGGWQKHSICGYWIRRHVGSCPGRESSEWRPGDHSTSPLLPATWTLGARGHSGIKYFFGHFQLKQILFISNNIDEIVWDTFLKQFYSPVYLLGCVWCVVWTSVWFLISKLIIFNPKLKTKKFCPEKGYIILDSHSFL